MKTRLAHMMVASCTAACSYVLFLPDDRYTRCVTDLDCPGSSCQTSTGTCAGTTDRDAGSSSGSSSGGAPAGPRAPCHEPEGNVVEVATGGKDGKGVTCARFDLGGVKCWGYNQAGQAGAPADAGPFSHVPRALCIQDAVALRVGGEHVCARVGEGSLWCWGSNARGQTSVPAGRFPAPVSGFKSPNLPFALGDEHTCAALADGGVVCMGQNQDGQAPARVSLAADVTVMAAGRAHTCALDAPGQVWCWGDNSGQQRGPAPGPATDGVGGLVAAADYTCGVRNVPADPEAGVQEHQLLTCWGYNVGQMLGQQTGAHPPNTAQVPLQGRIVAGDAHMCAHGSVTRRVYCWGANDRCQTQRSDGGGPFSIITGFPGVALQLAAGGNQTCVITDDAGVWCWGANESGQLGVAPADGRCREPVRVPL